jgi:hypothetical protein
MNFLSGYMRYNLNKQAKESMKICLPITALFFVFSENVAIKFRSKPFCFIRISLGICLSGFLFVTCASGQRMAGNIELISRGMDCQWLSSGFTIDGQDASKYWSVDPKAKLFGYQIPQGHRNVEVWIEWSNKFKDYTQLKLDVKEKRFYVVHAIELQTGQDSAAPMPCTVNQSSEYIERKSTEQLTGVLVGLLAAPLFYGPLPLGYAFLPAFEQSKKGDNQADQDKVAIKNQPDETPATPTARPYDGCCYVWIEDIGTREVVAGTRPPGASK